jgi:hypothetical protein
MILWWVSSRVCDIEMEGETVDTEPRAQASVFSAVPEDRFLAVAARNFA